MTQEHGSDHISYKWMVGIFSTIIFMGFGTWMTMIFTSIRTQDAILTQHGERIASLESTMRSVNAHLGSIDNNVERIVSRTIFDLQPAKRK